MSIDVEELKSKYRKISYLLGELVYRLHRKQDVRFLYTSDGVEDEKEIEKLLNLMSYLKERIEKIEELSSGEDEDGTDEDGEKEVPQEEEPPVPEEEAPDAREEMLPQEAADEAPTLSEIEAAAPAQEDGKEAPAADTSADESFERLAGHITFESDAEKKLFRTNLDSLKGGNEKERERSVRAMAHLSDKKGLKGIYRRALRDESPEVRLAVVKSLSKFGDGTGEDLYKVALLDDNSKVKTAALKALSAGAKEGHLSVLEPLLKDEDPLIRGMVGTCLGIYYGRRGVELAVTLLKDESAQVRKSTVDMLAVVKPKDSIDMIQELLDDPDDDVRKSAGAALQKCTSIKKEAGYEKRKKR